MCVWDLERGALLQKIDLDPRGDRPGAVAFVPGTRRLVVGGERGLLYVFEVQASR